MKKLNGALNTEMDVPRMQKAQRSFAKQREWEQFHTPKNLVGALMIEAGELLELVQWMDKEQVEAFLQSRAGRSQFADELADVLYYLIRLSDLAQIDLSKSFWNKMKKNARKYPVHLARGNAKKYTELKKSATKKRT